VTDLGEMGQ
jgi:hypothetical protein